MVSAVVKLIKKFLLRSLYDNTAIVPYHCFYALSSFGLGPPYGCSTALRPTH